MRPVGVTADDDRLTGDPVVDVDHVTVGGRVGIWVQVGGVRERDEATIGGDVHLAVDGTLRRGAAVRTGADHLVLAGRPVEHVGVPPALRGVG